MADANDFHGKEGRVGTESSATSQKQGLTESELGVSWLQTHGAGTTKKRKTRQLCGPGRFGHCSS